MAVADRQRVALYDFEDDWWGWDRNTATLAECRGWIETACAYYRVEPPKVVQHHKWTMSFSIPAHKLISLQALGAKKNKLRGGLNIAIALHEAAHHIVYWCFGNGPQDHGPTFCGVYLWLLAKAGVAPQKALEAGLKVRGLKWRHMPPTMPEIDRARPRGGAANQGTPRRLRGPTS